MRLHPTMRQRLARAPRRLPARHLPRWLRLLGLAGLAAVCACAGRPAELPGPLRWIDEPPTRLFDPRLLSEVRPVFEWSFTEPRDLRPWDIQNTAAAPQIGGGALILNSGPVPIRLTRHFDLPATAVDEIEVVLQGAEGGRVRLYWSAPGELFSPESSWTLEPEPTSTEISNVYRFPVAAHPLWRGQIERLRLDPTNLPARSLRLVSLRGFDLAVTPERLAEAVAVPWQVDLASEVRNALLAPPGLELEREMELPADVEGSLNFAYGVPEGVRDPIRFQVEIEPLETPGEEGKAKAENPRTAGRQTLFEGEVGPGADGAAAGLWHDAAVDLGPWAGRRVRLTLRSEAAARGDAATDTLDLAHGVPVFANPRWVARPPEGRPVARRPNVLLVSIDTLRADHLSLYGYPWETTPRLDAWARQHGAVFTSTVAPAPWTLPSHLSMFTGLDTLSHGVNYDVQVPSAVDTLAEVLRRAGYSTRAVTGGAYLHPRFGLAQGFDRWFAWPADRDPGEELEANVDRALSWLDDRGEAPFFWFFHTYEVHQPFHAREPFLERFPRAAEAADFAGRLRSGPAPPQAPDDFLIRKAYSVAPPGGGPRSQHVPLAPSETELVRSLYDSGVAYVDSQLHRLLERLEELGLLQDTLVIVTSDHGEALGEHGGLAAHLYLDDFNLMVPLVIAFPDGLGAGRTVGRQVRTIDIVPTVLETLGLPLPEGLDGASLRPLLDSESREAPREAWSYAASSNYGISLRLDNRLKYIYRNAAWGPIHGHEELYRLEEDPHEETNTADGTPEAERLRRRVEQRYREAGAGVRLRLVNRGTEAYRLLVTGPQLIRTATVKAADLPGPRVSWRGGGRALFEAPPGSDYPVLLERLPGAGPFDLEVGAESGPATAITIDARELAAAPLRLVLDGGRWRPEEEEGGSPGSPAASEPAQMLEISLVAGAVVPDAETPTDPALMEQLQALGYVN